jgi:serine phosphatase RsbU (regulator of sigma subunit)
MKNILNTGVSPLNDEGLNRKIRISNLISTITIVIMCGFLPLAIRYHVKGIIIFDFLFLFISLSNFFLHRKKLHAFSFYVSCIYGVVYFGFGTVFFGLISNLQFFLLVMCSIAIVLFDGMIFLKIYVAIAIATFFFVFIYMTGRAGLIPFGEDMKRAQQIIGLVNLFTLFFITVVFLLFFKRDNVLFQKAIIEQKKLVQEKQKEIIDSITYAKRIQEAILPSPHYWLKNLPDSFVLYKPKDIVAGDFYWMETFTNSHSKTGRDFIFFAAADCTGHGVPGAMVSVVCNNALNRSLLEFKLTDTGEVLDKTRELVIATFGKSDKEVKDGMDISLCRLDPGANELQWSGSNNPLWYIHNSELKEIKPNKQPIGNYAEQKPFTAHTLQLEKGDLIYIFTDGYADQFGGPNGKKFKHKQLEEKLLSICGEPLNKQKEILDQTFEGWRKNLEQIDDVCVIGIRI